MRPIDSNLSGLFYAGKYDEILALSVDRPDLLFHPYSVGALSLSGRLDEAEAAASVALRRPSDPQPESSKSDRIAQTAIRFFMCAGYCHAGRAKEALQAARQNLPSLRSTLPEERFYAAQGLGLVFYFTGKMSRATIFAKLALHAAIEAESPYERFLALDLRGHILVQLGQLFAGLRLLKQARQVAELVGAHANARTLQASIMIYEISCRLPESEARMGELEDLARSPDVSFFASRSAFNTLARHYACRGHRVRANEALRDADRISLPDGDRRGDLRSSLSHAIVCALQEGTASAEPFLVQAESLAGNDRALCVEVAFARAILGQALGSSARGQSAAVLYTRTNILRAKVVKLLAEDAPASRVPLEDRFSQGLLELNGKSVAEKVRVLVANDLLGLLSIVLGIEPGCHIVEIDELFILTDHGEITCVKAPSGPSLKVLKAISNGAQTAEQLFLEVWGIGRYSPTRHGPTIHSAVSRLRNALVPHGDWIETTQDGYTLAPGVDHVVVRPASSSSEVGGAEVTVDAPQVAAKPDRKELCLQAITQLGEASCPAIAESLETSPASALRLLRSLVEAGFVQKVGKGKSTRYRLAPS